MYCLQAIKYLLNIFHCFRRRQERRALATSAACSQLSHRRPCSEGWMSALRQRNVIRVLSGRKRLEGWKQREGGIKLEETKEKIESKNRGREGKKVDFERRHEMMWRHSVPVRQNPIHPSSHAQNNDRFISLIPYRFLQQGGDDIKVVLKLKFRNSSIT